MQAEIEETNRKDYNFNKQLCVGKNESKLKECVAFEDCRVGLISVMRANAKTIISQKYYRGGGTFIGANNLLTSLCGISFLTGCREDRYFK